ncbi:hypothetical protein FCR2A7T_09460 [Flavobacterium cauense R2A-7]|nr:hypothetical protein FCR2A7T_09460 [Flavobacterium cauense R2A-7]
MHLSISSEVIAFVFSVSSFFIIKTSINPGKTTKAANIVLKSGFNFLLQKIEGF